MASAATERVREALRKAFPVGEYALFFEVAAGTGMSGQRRRADAVAVGCWPSRGMLIEGMEIKVGRGDWLREQQRPEKAEEIARYCDHWWLVTTEGVVADVSEIPTAWGWLLLDAAGRLKRAKQPERLAPAPLDRPFVASLLRTAKAASEAELAAAASKAVAAHRQRLEDTIDGRIRSEVARRTADAGAVHERYQLAESIIGGDRWLDNVEFLAAVKLVMSLGLTSSYGRLQQLRQQIGHAAEGFDAALAGMDLPAAAELEALRKHLRKGKS